MDCRQPTCLRPKSTNISEKMVTFNRHRQPLSTLAARSKIIQMEHFCVRPLDRQSDSSVPMNFIKFESSPTQSNATYPFASHRIAHKGREPLCAETTKLTIQKVDTFPNKDKRCPAGDSCYHEEPEMLVV